MHCLSTTYGWRYFQLHVSFTTSPEKREMSNEEIANALRYVVINLPPQCPILSRIFATNMDACVHLHSSPLLPFTFGCYHIRIPHCPQQTCIILLDDWTVPTDARYMGTCTVPRYNHALYHSFRLSPVSSDVYLVTTNVYEALFSGRLSLLCV